MARKGRAEKRALREDSIFESKLVTEFINKMLWKGKKSLAEKIVYESLDILQKKTKENPVEILEKCMENVKPVLEIRPRRVGGATYQVPIEVTQERANTLAVRWIIGFARKEKKNYA